uniref:Ig-like domain-containing protein n=1 Tax=Gopherus evgoodei TaxID=1825980 RepID=A0A8C4WPE8_9SAUR
CLDSHPAMKLLLISLLALVSPTSVSSQVTLVQSGQGLLKPSESLKLTCAVSGVSIIDGCCWWHWVRQRPGRAWQWLGLIKNDGSVVYAQSFPSRLTVSRDTAKNAYYLQLSSMTNEDTATYYCTRDTLNRNQ